MKSYVELVKLRNKYLKDFGKKGNQSTLSKIKDLTALIKEVDNAIKPAKENKGT